VVLADADLDLAVDGILGGIYVHSGQICMAGSRALVHRDRYQEFVELFRDRAAGLVVGDPGDMRTDLGPLVSRQQARTVARYVSLGIAQGATLVSGGSRPAESELAPGLDARAFFQPTVLAGVDSSNVVFREEIFGPVLAVTPFGSDEEALTLANDSRYRLAGAVWSADLEHAWQVADRLRAERVWVNDYQMFDLATPDADRAATLADRLDSDMDDYRVMRRLRVTTAGRLDQLWGVLGTSPARSG
jgi:aldehyde dehydrogenase (NAD+)